MNLDLFDDVEGVIFHEREASLSKMNMSVNDESVNISKFPRNTPLAMAYVPFQQWNEIYDDDKALARGTLFPDLDLPFSKGGDTK